MCTTDAAVEGFGGSEDDVVTVGRLAPAIGGSVDGVDGLLTIAGNGGSDTVKVDDTGSAGSTGAWSAATVTGLGMASGIVYGTVEVLDRKSVERVSV